MENNEAEHSQSGF